MNTFIILLYLYSIVLAIIITLLSRVVSFLGICPRCFKYLRRKDKNNLVCNKCNSYYEKEEKKKEIIVEETFVSENEEVYYKPLKSYGKSSYYSESLWNKAKKNKIR